MGTKFTVEAEIMKCENCGSEHLELQSAEGVLERFLCLTCGHVTIAKAIYSTDRLFAFADQNDVFLEVSILEPAAKVQAMKLRATLPELKNLPLDLFERHISSGKLDFGRQSKDRVDAIRLALEGAKLQFKLHIQPCSANGV